MNVTHDVHLRNYAQGKGSSVLPHTHRLLSSSDDSSPDPTRHMPSSFLSQIPLTLNKRRQINNSGKDHKQTEQEDQDKYKYKYRVSNSQDEARDTHRRDSSVICSKTRNIEQDVNKSYRKSNSARSKISVPYEKGEQRTGIWKRNGSTSSMYCDSSSSPNCTVVSESNCLIHDTKTLLEALLSDSQRQARSFNLSGTAAFRKGLYDEAHKLYRRAFGILQTEVNSIPEVEEEDKDDDGDDGYGFFDDCNDEKYERKRRQEAMGVVLLIQTLNNMAIVKWRGGKLNDAMTPLKDAQAISNRSLNTTQSLDIHVSSSSSSVSSLSAMNILLSRSRSQLRVSSFDSELDRSYCTASESGRDSKYSIAIEEAKILAEISMYLNMGIVLQMKGDLEHAMKSLRDAKRLLQCLRSMRKRCQSVEDEIDLNEVRIHCIMATIRVKRGEYDTALKMHQEALRIKAGVLGMDHPTFVVSLLDVAQVHNLMGNIKQSISCYSKALRRQRSTLPTDHLDIALTLHSLGRLYRKSGEDNRATELFQEAMRIYEVCNLDDRYMVVASLVRDIADANIDKLHRSREEFNQRYLPRIPATK